MPILNCPLLSVQKIIQTTDLNVTLIPDPAGRQIHLVSLDYEGLVSAAQQITIQEVPTNPVINRTVADGVSTASSTTLTSATAAFTSADVGRYIRVIGAGSGGGTLLTYIRSVTNGTTVVLQEPALTTDTDLDVVIYNSFPTIAVLAASITAGVSGKLDLERLVPSGSGVKAYIPAVGPSVFVSIVYQLV